MYTKAFDKNGRIKPSYLKKNNITSEEFYLLYYDIIKPNCLCGKSLNFISFGSGYNKWCSASCANKYKKNRKLTEQELKEAQQKREKTSLDKYGVTNYSTLKEAQQKREKTSLDKYGVTNFNKLDSSKENISNVLKNKSKDEKDAIYNKRKQTNEKKYGSTNNTNQHIKNKNNLNKEYIIENFINDGLFDNYSFMIYFNIGETTSQYIRKEYNIDAPLKRRFGKTQHEIFNFIKQYDNTVQENFIKDGYEIDIYSENIQIEYNGLLWHSFGKDVFDNTSDESRRKYHLLEKTNRCGLIFQIFENEWLNEHTKDIWKSVLLSKLHKTTKIAARKCQISEITSKEYYNFCQDNHLQGGIHSSIRIGLFYNNELISVMGFSKPRFNKNYNYELIRFCTIKNITVQGGASKLLKYFTRNYKGSIISYANRRWSDGNLYKKLGFELINTTQPNFYFFKLDEQKLISRMNFQKHKIQFEPYDEGYRKIYDCGNYVFGLNT